MKKALLLLILPLTLALTGAEPSFAQDTAAPSAESPAKDAGRQKVKKNRKKSAKKAPAAEAETGKAKDVKASLKEAYEPPAKDAKPRGKRTAMKELVGSVSAERPVLKTLDTKKADSLLYKTMEKLETLLALYDNLRLQASEDTANKAAELERAANKAAADFFKTEELDPGRDAVKGYRGLLNSTLGSLKILKDVKDRVIPEDTEKALALCKDLSAAIDKELAGAKLKAEASAEAAATQEEAKAPVTTVTEPAAPGETALSGEAGALATLAELRKAVEAYKAAESKYPKKLNKLTPKYMPEMPAISVADHSTTDEVLEIDSADYDDALHQAITDSGKWLYFTNKKSKYYGLVLIDCSHKTAKGVELYKVSAGK